MKSDRVFGEWLLRLVLRMHPVRFRQAFEREMVEYYRDMMRSESARGPSWRAVFLVRSIGSAIRTGVRQRLGAEPASPAGASSSGGGLGLGALRDDAVYALRSLRKQPRFVVAVIVVLALALGANTAVFGVLNAVLLLPLPYPEPDRLVRLYEAYRETSDDLGYVTEPAFAEMRENAESFASLAAVYTYAEQGADVTGTGSAERLRILRVTSGYLEVLGVTPERGRGFVREEERDDAAVVVVSRAVADRLLGGASTGTLVLDGVPREVIGVMAADFEDPLAGSVDVWLPLPIRAGGWESYEWDNHWLSVIGRLAPGTAIGAAQTEVTRRFGVQATLAREAENKVGRLVPLHEDVIGSADRLLVLLSGAVGFLVLVACVNVAGLVLARGATRERDLAVRTALGSPRGRLVRQLVLESLFLGIGGGVAGLVVGNAVSRGMVGLAPVDLVRGGAIPFDLRVFGFSLGAALVSGMLFGLAPALVLTRRRLEHALREGGRTRGPARHEGMLRAGLVVAQVALSLILLVGAGLLVRTLDRMRSADLGFERRDAITFQVNLPAARYEGEARRRFHDELQRELASLPVVARAGAVSHLPSTGFFLGWGVRRVEGDRPVDGSMTNANQRTVNGDYFDALDIALLDGRVFGTPEDDPDAPPRVVISRSLADRLFPDGGAVGGRVRVGGENLDVIGVVSDVAVGLRESATPIVYHDHRQYWSNRNWPMSVVLVPRGSPAAVIDQARRVLASLDPQLVMHRVEPMTEVVGRGTRRERFVTLLLLAFATLAVVLAAVGVYGVLAYAVKRRQREIGVRLALGAPARTVRWMIIGRGAWIAAVGVGTGLAGAMIATTGLSSIVFGISVRDPAVFGAAAVILGTIALAASWMPARAAVRVDPMRAFREE